MESKILVLTDLNWNIASKRISIEDIQSLVKGGKMGRSERYVSLRKYWHIVEEEQPELVLLGGDLTGDGSCGHGFHLAFYYLLVLLNQSKIQSFFIKGDNDLKNYYAFILDNYKSLTYVQEISNKAVMYKSLRILGIPFQTTRSKKALKKLLSESNDHFDLVLCHSELKRRTFLFDLNAELIITGHFDNKLCCINNSIFLSLSNDSSVINYALISLRRNESRVTYNYIHPIRRRRITYSKSIANLKNNTGDDLINSDKVLIPIQEFEKLVLPNSEYEKDKNALALSLKYLRGREYKSAIDYMLSESMAKELDIIKMNFLKRKFFTPKHKLSKSMLSDFLGSKASKEL